mmetsp:Transcript_25378/g.43196  ORF Transcript_25378/g.43196 Transcript_25378/m.43196 type:complete len:211 (-) Transcript_25378:60-692(-)
MSDPSPPKDEEQGAGGGGAAASGEATEGDALLTRSTSVPIPSHEPDKNPCLHCLQVVQWAVVINLICILAAQILPLFFMSLPQIGHVQMLLRVYMSLFCLLFILVETRAPIPLLRSPVLTLFLSRGFFYSFFAIVSLEESIALNYRGQIINRGTFYIGWPSLFMELTAYVLFIAGTLYMILGCCCVGKLKEKMEDDLREEINQFRQHSHR